MRSSRWLDRGLAVGLLGSLVCHAAAIGAIALVRFDLAASPIQVELVELAAPAPEPAPRPTPTKAAQAPEPELAAPAPPEPPAVPERVEPRISVAVSAPILPERVTASPVRRPSEEPPAPTVRRAERTEPVSTAAPTRPERPLAERSETMALQTLTAETTALPERVERRAAAPATGPSPKPSEPALAAAGPAQAVRPAGQPTVELGRVERTDEPHLTALLASRTAEPDVPAAPPAPPRELAAAAPTGDRQPTPLIAAPSARPTLPPAGGLQAALPPAAGNAGAFVAPRLTAPKRPRYPEAARQAGVEGTVLVKAYILADGSVRDALVARSAGNSALDGAALRTIRESRFTPAQRGGRPVPVWVEVPIDFRLER
jgi:periplasmic protein TonB